MSDTITVWMTQKDAKQYMLYRAFQRGCEGKKAYKSQAQALATRDSVLKRKPLAPVNGANAYKCQFCGSWHLGHGRRAR